MSLAQDGRPAVATGARRGSHFPPLALTAAAGVILSLTLFTLVRNGERRELVAEFERRAVVPATALQQELNQYLNLLQSVEAFYFSSKDVDRREFEGFTREALRRMPGLVALEWIPRVSGASRASHESDAQRDGFAGYQLLEPDAQGQPVRAGVRDEYLPIYFAEPATQRALQGQDLALNEVFSAAMARAREEGLPQASAPFHPGGRASAGWHYRVFVAVYTNLVVHDTPEERRAVVAGYAAAVIDVSRFAFSALTNLSASPARGLAWLLTDTRGGTLAQSVDWPEAMRVVGATAAASRLNLPGRDWRLLCRPTRAYLARHLSWPSWGVLAGGLVVTFLIVAYLSTTLGRAAHIERLVEARTAELAEANRELKTEVCERQRVAGELAAERELVAALLDNSPDHIYFKDRESRFIRINQSMAGTFGLAHSDQAQGKSDADFFTIEHARRTLRDEEEILRTGQPLVGREECETWPDGSTTWASSTKQCLRDSAGTIVGTFGVSRDITARKRAERQLNVQYTLARVLAEAGTFAEAAPQILQSICECLGWQTGGVWTVDPHSDVLRCLEIWSAPDVPALEFVAASRARTFAAGVGLPGRVWTTAEPAWIRDVTCDPNFPRAPLAVQAGLHGAFGFPILSGGSVLGVIEFFSRRIEQPDEDLLKMLGAVGQQIGQFIERRRTQQTLAQQARELARSNEELERFAYVASHDLQEPLRMVASYTQLLQRRYHDKLDAEAHQFIHFAVDGAARMQGLIHDLLAYSRVGTTAKPLTRIDLNAVLQKVMVNLKIAIEESHARITAQPLPTVLGDATHLTQLLQNLLGNALKFRGDKPAVVHLSAELRPAVLVSEDRPADSGRQSSCEWVFAVRDEGIGIEPQYFKRIFVIFQRLHTREEYAGTGIGLAVCQKIVERHGGRIWVESEFGHGSTFYFTMPPPPEPEHGA